jgi:hypothetical protein
MALSPKKTNLKILSSAFFFFLISIAFVLTMLRFGIPLIISFTSLLVGKNSPVADQSQDFIPPPELYSSKSVTNSATTTLEGKSFVNGQIKVFVNNQETAKIEVKANEDLLVPVALEEEENTIYAIVQNEKGKISGPSKSITVIYDSTSPNLEISSPSDQSRFSGNSQKTIEIEGQADKESTVFINERQVVVDKNGRFRSKFNLLEGENIIKITAERPSGSKTEKEIIVYFNP